MNLTALKFDNPNNASMSLHAIAEWVRIGDMTFLNALISPVGATLNLKVRGGPRPNDTPDRPANLPRGNRRST